MAAEDAEGERTCHRDITVCILCPLIAPNPCIQTLEVDLELESTQNLSPIMLVLIMNLEHMIEDSRMQGHVVSTMECQA